MARIYSIGDRTDYWYGHGYAPSVLPRLAEFRQWDAMGRYRRAEDRHDEPAMANELAVAHYWECVGRHVEAAETLATVTGDALLWMEEAGLPYRRHSGRLQRLRRIPGPPSMRVRSLRGVDRQAPDSRQRRIVVVTLTATKRLLASNAVGGCSRWR